jgi:hypothetical protein
MYCVACIVYRSSSMIAIAGHNIQYSLNMTLQELKHVGVTNILNKVVYYYYTSALVRNYFILPMYVFISFCLT